MIYNEKEQRDYTKFSVALNFENNLCYELRIIKIFFKLRLLKVTQTINVY